VAFRHGAKAVVLVGGTDISAYCNSVSMDIDVDNNDSTTFGSTWKTNLPGLPGATNSLEGLYDPTITTGPVAVLLAAITSALAGTSVAVVYRPGGTTSGQTQHSFSANITNYSENSAADGLTAFSSAFQVTGAITTTTQ
jgi:hypothetical protein